MAEIAAAERSQERRAKGSQSTGTAGVSGYTEEDLKEHLKLTCSIIIDDVSEHWDSYERKFRQA